MILQDEGEHVNCDPHRVRRRVLEVRVRAGRRHPPSDLAKTRRVRDSRRFGYVPRDVTGLPHAEHHVHCECNHHNRRVDRSRDVPPYTKMPIQAGRFSSCPRKPWRGVHPRCIVEATRARRPPWMMTFIWISSETRSDSQACRRNLRRVVDSAGLDSFAAVFQICLFVAQNCLRLRRTMSSGGLEKPLRGSRSSPS